MDGFLGEEQKAHVSVDVLQTTRGINFFLSCLNLQDSLVLLPRSHPVTLQYWFSILLCMLAHTISKNS